MTKVKICGISRQADIDMVNIEKPNYIGFVFAKSRRQVSPQVAKELRGKLHRHIVPVGVFVDETIENIVSLVQDGTIEMVQLHGKEDDDYIRKLKRSIDVPIIKAISIERNEEVSSAADYLLLDSATAGSGQTFDWNLIGGLHRPFFLAGGLNVENVKAAVTAVAPYAVDVSSGVETDGVKDYTKVKEFIRRARNG